MLSTAWVVPGIIGPSIAAVVGEFASWRWVFLGLVPLLADRRVVRRTSRSGASRVRRRRRSTRRRPPRSAACRTRSSPRRRGHPRRRRSRRRSLPIIVGGAAIGLLLLVPAFGRLTPRGTLLLAIGVPAAVLLRGVMTFSFFSADAFLPLLLQTWRGTPATLTGVVFTATTIAWTAGTWYQARHIDRWGARRFVALGFAFIIAGVAADAAGRALVEPRRRSRSSRGSCPGWAWASCTPRSRSSCSAGRSRPSRARRAPRSSSRTSSAPRSGRASPGRSRRQGSGPAVTGSASRSRWCSGCRSRAPCSACSGSGRIGAILPVQNPRSAAVD